METFPNLIIVDDHVMFLEGLRSIISNEHKYNIICTAKNGDDVIKYLEVNTDIHIDLIITDISMPDMDGIALNTIVKKKFPDVKTLIVSMHNNEEMISLLIENKADGYITKDDASSSILFAAIDTILSGQSYFSDKIWKTYIDSKTRKEKALLENLSALEREIIQLIVLEHTTQEIADMKKRSTLTIDSYRKNLLAKIGARNSVGLAIWAIKAGLVEV